MSEPFLRRWVYCHFESVPCLRSQLVFPPSQGIVVERVQLRQGLSLSQHVFRHSDMFTLAVAEYSDRESEKPLRLSEPIHWRRRCGQNQHQFAPRSRRSLRVPQ